MKANNPSWLSERKVNILFQVGPRREPDLDAPLWSDLARDDEQRQILDVLSGDVAVGRPILTAPDVPAERVAALRAAFDATLKNPKFLEAAQKANMYLNPMGGEELQAIVSRIVSPSPAIIAKVKDAIRVTDAQQRPGARQAPGGGSEKE